jgi:hypothetical protein
VRKSEAAMRKGHEVIRQVFSEGGRRREGGCILECS